MPHTIIEILPTFFNTFNGYVEGDKIRLYDFGLARNDSIELNINDNAFKLIPQLGLNYLVSVPSTFPYKFHLSLNLLLPQVTNIILFNIPKL